MTGQVLTETPVLPASIEMLPKQVPMVSEIATLLPAGVRVYLTDIGSDEADAQMLTAARRLRDAGCIPVPHLAARRIASWTALEQRIGRLAEEAGVTDVLVIAGGVKSPTGPFESSMDLLETGLLDRFGITDLAIAGHPEGSPDFSEAIAMKALHQKREFAERTDARLRIVTQFGFDAEKTLAWAEGLQNLGIGIPIHIGAAGPAKITTLIKYGSLCGIGNSLSLLTRHSGNFLTLATGYSPEIFVAPIERYPLAKQSLISHIHVFPFGGLDKASAWLRKRGSW
ncbi:methylenetetrahydrofolate reductase [Rhizobium chutanense]|uniref:Methylenetetrahydrofolate reductase n=1 Tax=Rhizobium chutanense TaxID=2035448 RepID=A0A3S0R059_9HYPH|nr:methylenetetrahydrofolate reductase [Rhizobium chutanense]RUM05654.1 methylenetetrahydrofolate reductase [Rhizobium chutanense]